MENRKNTKQYHVTDIIFYEGLNYSSPKFPRSLNFRHIPTVCSTPLHSHPSYGGSSTSRSWTIETENSNCCQSILDNRNRGLSMLLELDLCWTHGWTDSSSLYRDDPQDDDLLFHASPAKAWSKFLQYLPENYPEGIFIVDSQSIFSLKDNVHQCQEKVKG